MFCYLLMEYKKQKQISSTKQINLRLRNILTDWCLLIMAGGTSLRCSECGFAGGWYIFAGGWPPGCLSLLLPVVLSSF